jgi:hypothetical protein
MIRVLLLIFLSILLQNGYTQSATEKFPSDFVGNWKGTLEWAPITRPVQTVNMELRIQPVRDSVNQFTWNLIYGSPSADNRPYILLPVDTARGHWVIDEKNGIVLDQYYVKGRLVGAFTVQQSTIVSTYTLIDGNTMTVEFVTYSSKPITTTGKGDASSPSVDSYEVKSIQKAVLRKGN